MGNERKGEGPIFYGVAFGQPFVSWWRSGDSNLEVVGDFSEGLKALGVFKRASEGHRCFSEGLRSLGVLSEHPRVIDALAKA